MKKIFTDEFKKMAVDLSYNSDKTVSELSKELGISESGLYLWRSNMKPSKSSKKTEEKDIKELKKKLAKLEVENEILKKALAICNRN